MVRGSRSNVRDPYEVLGVAEHASMDEVTAAYRRLVLEWHPDRHVGAGPRRHALAEMRMAEISGAYRVLLDPGRVGDDFDYRRAAPVEFEVSDS